MKKKIAAQIGQGDGEPRECEIEVVPVLDKHAERVELRVDDITLIVQIGEWNASCQELLEQLNESTNSATKMYEYNNTHGPRAPARQVGGTKMRASDDGTEVVCAGCDRSVAILDELGNPFWYPWGGLNDSGNPHCRYACEKS